MKLKETVNTFINLKGGRLSTSTRRNYLEVINAFGDYCKKNLKDISSKDIKEWLATLNSKPSAKACNLDILKKYFDYCIEEGYTVKNPVTPISNPALSPNKLVYLEKQQVHELLASASENSTERALLETLFNTGVRTLELINIKIEDVELKERTIRIKDAHGKERSVFFTHECGETLEKYLAGREDDSPFLFVSSNGNPMDQHKINNIMKKYSTKLGFEISGSILRNTLEAKLVKNGCPIEVVCEIMGERMSSDRLSQYRHLA